MRWKDPPPSEDGGEIEAYLVTWEAVSVFSFFAGDLDKEEVEVRIPKTHIRSRGRRIYVQVKRLWRHAEADTRLFPESDVMYSGAKK
eukprot:2678837-Pyramimonas_sp.AAC.1